MGEVILKVNNLKKYYKSGSMFSKKSIVKALDGVSFELKKGETLGIVGESGCGKSTLAKAVIRLIEPTEGEIILNNRDFRKLSGRKLKNARKQIKMIFQDPYSSLNPRMTVRDIIGEPLDIAGSYKDIKERNGIIESTMEMVGLDLSWANRYPHEFSGGQRQRLGIAKAIIQRPDVIICDEPVSALDVSIQAKIINLLLRLQRELNISYIFISHDLGVVKHIADRVIVMYKGRAVEVGDVEEIFEHPTHEYTKRLLLSIPVIQV